MSKMSFMPLYHCWLMPSYAKYDAFVSPPWGHYSGGGFAQIVEERRLERAFGSAGKDGDDHFAAILVFTRFLQGCPGYRAAADANREPFFFHNLDGGGYGIMVGNRDDAINE